MFHGTHIGHPAAISRRGCAQGVPVEQGGIGSGRFFSLGFTGIRTQQRCTGYIKRVANRSKAPEGVVLEVTGMVHAVAPSHGGHSREMALAQQGCASRHARHKQRVMHEEEACVAYLHIVVD